MLSFIAIWWVLGAAAVAVRARRRRRLRTVALVIAALAAGAAIAAAPSGLALDKVLARCVLPAGFVWCAVVGAAWLAFVVRKDGAAVGLALLAAAYWLAGAPVVGQWLIARVETPYAQLDPLSLPPLDAVAVLGGGTRSVEGRPRLDLAGDRVLLGAQLYLSGKARRLITTGSSIPELGPPRDLTEETALIWQDLGVPADAIIRISSPRNTSQEIAALETFVETSTTIRTLGLVTSAWHLPRALALADRVGLDVVPLPADVHTDPGAADHLQNYIPDGTGFHDVHRAGWELLGRAVGR